MGMFSQHFIIRGPDGGYWDGNSADTECWTADWHKIVRFYSRQCAEAVLRGVLAPIAETCKIEEDE